MTDSPARERHDDRLREAMQPAPLSARQRQRHRARIQRLTGASAYRSAHRRRGRLEYAVIGLALLLVIVGAALWSRWNPESDDDPGRIAAGPPPIATPAEQDGLALTDPTRMPDEAPPGATMPSLGLEQVEGVAEDACEVSPYTKAVPPDAPMGLDFPDWYGDPASGLWLAPADLSMARPGGHWPMGGGNPRWFAGAPSVVQVHGATTRLVIRGERADGEDSFEVEPPATVDEMTNSQRAVFEIPTPGCWALTVQTEDRELTFVVDVLPREERPDLIALEQLAAIRPYEPPPGCPATPVTEPQLRGNAIVFRHWLEDGDIAVDIDQAWYVAGREESMNIVGVLPGGDARVTGHMRGEGGHEIVPESQSPVDTGIYMIMVFPAPGCWEVIVETDTRAARFIAYIYPPACAPPPGLGELAPGCSPPTGRGDQQVNGFQA